MRVTVSKEDIRHNYRLLKERAGVPVIPVLKANGYGLGAEGMLEVLKEEEVSLAQLRLQKSIDLVLLFVDFMNLLLITDYNFLDEAK